MVSIVRVILFESIKLMIVLGAANTDAAKITGNTPELLILIGICVVSFVHCWIKFVAYIIGIFLTPSLNTTKITIAKYTMTNNAYHKIPKIIVCVPLSNETKLLNVVIKLVGKLATIPVKINNDVPFPTPFLSDLITHPHSQHTSCYHNRTT